MNLAENLTRSARARGRSAALAVGDRVATFGDLDRASRRVAGHLAQRGVRPGDRVGVLVPDGEELAALYYGILRLGGVVVPLPPVLDEAEVTHRLDDSGARLLVASGETAATATPAAHALGADLLVLASTGLAELLADAPSHDRVEPRAADDTAVIAYTAGTTGEPRGAELTHGNLSRNCEVVVNDLLQLTSEDVVLAAVTLSCALGQTAGLNAAVRAGACLVLLARFDGEGALRVLADRRVTVVVGVPARYAALLRHRRRSGPDVSRLRFCLSGGAAMPVDVLLGIEEAFGCLVLEGYGLTEGSPVVSSNRRDRRRVGSMGAPVPGVELRVVDEDGGDVEDGEPGEIWVRGPHVMKGYWGRPAETAAAVVGGWLRTRDVGVRDGEGFLHVLDRTDELIDRGDQRVYPREVEEVLREHPDVLAAAVVGRPHPTLGEEVGAVVTLRPRASATDTELRDFVRRRVAAHQYPRTVDVVDELPTTATGTIRKRAIRLETRP